MQMIKLRWGCLKDWSTNGSEVLLSREMKREPAFHMRVYVLYWGVLHEGH